MTTEDKFEPVAIDTITAESLKGKSAKELDALYRYMFTIKMTLLSRMDVVAHAREYAERLEHHNEKTDKMGDADAQALEDSLATRAERKAKAQELGGDHIVQDEQSTPGDAT